MPKTRADMTERKLIIAMIGLHLNKEFSKADEMLKRLVDYKLEKRFAKYN